MIRTPEEVEALRRADGSVDDFFAVPPGDPILEMDAVQLLLAEHISYGILVMAY